ncbi:MAG: DUF3297 family protein [Sphingomonadales bacterium]|nr:DUF3297 family protein [Sphingomonadales bacterium]
MTEDQQQAAAAATQEPATAAASHPPAPDRLSNNPRSEFFDMDILQRGIGISFNGKQRHDVEEYCVSEGWIKVAAGKSRDRFGNPMTITLKGPVEAWIETGADDAA